MIVAAGKGALRLVTQPDHAHFAAALLSLWQVPELARHPRRHDLLRAIRLHDNGWRELDAAPVVAAGTGAVASFVDLPDSLRLEVWQRGTRRYAETDPYVALLAVEHCRTLFSGRRCEPPWRELLTGLDQLADELLARTGLDAGELAADYGWLELADRLSLLSCAAWQEPLECRGWRARQRAEMLEITPFPLAGATRFEVPCRTIPERRYEGDADLGVTLASARWQTFAVHVRPADPSFDPPAATALSPARRA